MQSANSKVTENVNYHRSCRENFWEAKQGKGNGNSVLLLIYVVQK